MDLMFKKHSVQSPHRLESEENQLNKENSNNGSVFKFLWCYLKFTSEPLWYRMTIIIIAVTAILLMIWFLKEWVAPAFILEKISQVKLSSILAIFKRNST
jgi:hypothetical protein